MKKNVFIFAGIILILTSMISAYSFNPLSIGQFFDTLGGENLGLIAIWVISFAIFSIALNKSGFFGEKQGLAIVVAIVLSALVTFWTYRQGIDFGIDNFIYGMGISGGTMDVIVFFGIAALVILMFYKFKANALLLLGVMLLILGFIAELGGEIYLIAIGLIVVGIIIKSFSFWASRRVFGAKSKYNFNPKIYYNQKK